MIPTNTQPAQQQATCATCRWYHYLPTLEIHLCYGPGAGEISEQEVRNVSTYGCDAYEPRQEARP